MTPRPTAAAGATSPPATAVSFDEGSVTVTQVQSLRLRNAGIKVPPDVIKKAVKYLQDSTGSDKGVVYSLAQGGGGGGRPALTAAAIACGFGAGEYNSKHVKMWFEYCETHVPLLRRRPLRSRRVHPLCTTARSLYCLGNDGYAKLFPHSKEKDKLSWNKYREITFDHLKQSQSSEGTWSGSHVGPVFATFIYCIIMQLDNACLPIYQR